MRASARSLSLCGPDHFVCLELDRVTGGSRFDVHIPAHVLEDETVVPTGCEVECVVDVLFAAHRPALAIGRRCSGSQNERQQYLSH